MPPLSKRPHGIWDLQVTEDSEAKKKKKKK
jgi:hypothetical protein